MPQSINLILGLAELLDRCLAIYSKQDGGDH